ncbi:hemolytic protein HlpA [Paludibacter sp.]
MSYNIPILFIVFKRPKVASIAFEQIRKVKPKKLYLACDAARPHVTGENLLVEETKKTITDMIDWDCELKTLYHTTNQGCSDGVYKAINWMFEYEETGIILEDDCVVNLSFFRYVDEMLLKYKEDNRIGMIAGTNKLKINIKESYLFSRYKACWGWATWKRAWKNMDIAMKWKDTDYYDSVLSNMGHNGRDIKYWKYRIDLIKKDRVSAWDWQWYFSLAAQNQLSIFPKVNLVTNIGFGEGATHTTNKSQPQEYTATQELQFPLIHPEYVVPHDEFDRAFYRDNNSLFYTLMRYTPYFIKTFVKKLIR